MYVIPQPGRLVRDPLTGIPLPEIGADVPETSYWLRRLTVGDVRPLAPSIPVSSSEGQ